MLNSEKRLIGFWTVDFTGVGYPGKWRKYFLFRDQALLYSELPYHDPPVYRRIGLPYVRKHVGSEPEIQSYIGRPWWEVLDHMEVKCNV